MKVCAYVMTFDSGLAPNPFHGVCTLAVCTPNHMRAHLQRGDWVVGVAGKALRERTGRPDQWRLVYAMKIRECITLGEYFESPLYEAKKPKWNGLSEDMCGDNFYAQNPAEGGRLSHTGATEEHKGIEDQDCGGNRVFIGDEYYYFGSLAPVLPTDAWGEKLKSRFKKSSVGLRYMLGGSGVQWSNTDFLRFLSFLAENTPNEPPAPINFYHWDQWKKSIDETELCGGCSK